jgi:AcrR family transcriptional regulator
MRVNANTAPARKHPATRAATIPARRTKMRPARGKRLAAESWIAAALDALGAGGIAAVRVEPLAATLSVTKGSFYWHFADRRALIEEMLKSWRDGRIAAIRAQAAGQDASQVAPAEILARLAALYTRRVHVKGLSIELAIRAFARNDRCAAAAVRAVDAERLRHVGALFVRMGWPAAQGKARAVLFYSYLFGQSLLDAAIVPASERDRAVANLMAPAQRRKKTEA